jgi:hypothetical protein
MAEVCKQATAETGEAETGEAETGVGGKVRIIITILIQFN